MAESDSSKLELKLIQDRPVEMGKNIYGVIFSSTSASETGRKLCCMNKKWGPGKKCSPYKGKAAKWLSEIATEEKSGKYHLIEIDGSQKMVKAVSVLKFHSEYYKSDLFGLKNFRKSLSQNVDLAKACFFSADFDYQYIGLDDFGNEAIIGELVRENVKSGINKIEFSGICGKYGLMMSDYWKLGNLWTFSRNIDKIKKDHKELFEDGIIKKKIITSIVSQVTSTLLTLQKNIEFLHSDLRVQNILVDVKKSEIVVGISDFTNSSATMKSLNSSAKKPIRIFNEYLISRVFPVGVDYKVKGTPDKNCFQIRVGSGQAGTDLGACKNSFWWKLPSSFNSRMSLITSHTGLPFYKSYDFYVFMVTLMLCSDFYSAIVSYTEVKGIIWDSLWLSSELDKVTADVVKKIGEVPTLDLVLSILNKYHMRCDAISLVSGLLEK